MSISLNNIESRVKVLESLKRVHLTPDVTKVTKINSPYTVQAPGFIIANMSEAYDINRYVKLNGVYLVSITAYKNTYYSNINTCIPVTIGDVITFSSPSGNAGGLESGVYFYPTKSILYRFRYILTSNIINKFNNIKRGEIL